MSNTVTFKIPSLPGSVNLIYAPRHTIHSDKFSYGLKDEWVIWKTQMKVFVPKFKIADDTLIRIDCRYTYNWYYKNTNLRVVDTHNMVKLLIDLIAEKVGFNDCRAKSGSWASVHNPTESFVEVTLTEIAESEWRAWT